MSSDILSGAAGDVAAFVSNVAASVLIVFANKKLMAPPVAFAFATCLCAFHFLTSGGVAHLIEGWKGVDKGTTQKPENVPRSVYLTFAFVAAASIATLNISLLVNTVGFYQVAKLLVIPFICLVEGIWFKRRFKPLVVAAIMVVVVGVGIVTVSDVSVNGLGLIIAMASVVCSGMQQILCGHIQRSHDVSPNQLLSLTAPIQGAALLVGGPFMDYLLSKQWIFMYQWNTQALVLLIISCTLAVGVNISQFMVLGRFSAVTFQVLGHTKTVLVLVCSWLFLKEPCTPRKVLGMALAVLGMAAYGYLSTGSSNAPPRVVQVPAAEEATEKSPLLLDSADKTGPHSADKRRGSNVV